jgi:hypothetical protein
MGWMKQYRINFTKYDCILENEKKMKCKCTKRNKKKLNIKN